MMDRSKRILDTERERLISIMDPHLSKDFEAGDRVAYIPTHADYDITHPDVEWGTVCSVNDKNVFVKFDWQVSYAGTMNISGQACTPSDLIIIR